MSWTQIEYEKRVNRVIDHIREHLGEELSLITLARVATFSPFHFHRVFKAITSETLFGYIHRVRIEKAAAALRDHPDRTVLEIALDHGFASSATFARAFRARFGMSASEWRSGGAERWRAGRRPDRKPGKQLGNGGKASAPRRPDTSRKRKEARPMRVDIKELPTQHVAYMRYVGPYGARGIPELWTRFGQWMHAHDFTQDTSVRLGVAYDDPAITAAEQCRYDACVVVPRDFPVDRWVNVMDVPGGKYAVAPFTGTAHEIEGAWDRVFASWLPHTAYQPDDRPCFELYRGNCTVDAATRTFRCELWLPVRAL